MNFDPPSFGGVFRSFLDRLFRLRFERLDEELLDDERLERLLDRLRDFFLSFFLLFVFCFFRWLLLELDLRDLLLDLAEDDDKEREGLDSSESRNRLGGRRPTHLRSLRP